MFPRRGGNSTGFIHTVQRDSYKDRDGCFSHDASARRVIGAQDAWFLPPRESLKNAASLTDTSDASLLGAKSSTGVVTAVSEPLSFFSRHQSFPLASRRLCINSRSSVSTPPSAGRLSPACSQQQLQHHGQRRASRQTDSQQL